MLLVLVSLGFIDGIPFKSCFLCYNLFCQGTFC